MYIHSLERQKHTGLSQAGETMNQERQEEQKVSDGLGSVGDNARRTSGIRLGEESIPGHLFGPQQVQLIPRP
jgi:hypothetical protein